MNLVFITSSTAFFLQMIKRQTQSGAVQPPFDVGGILWRLIIQAPESLSGELLGSSGVTCDAVEEPR
jgi:hypothetical protein